MKSTLVVFIYIFSASRALSVGRSGAMNGDLASSECTLQLRGFAPEISSRQSRCCCFVVCALARSDHCRHCCRVGSYLGRKFVGFVVALISCVMDANYFRPRACQSRDHFLFAGPEFPRTSNLWRRQVNKVANRETDKTKNSLAEATLKKIRPPWLSNCVVWLRLD